MHTYLFDFDGTLVDSMPTFVSAMLRILDENSISYDKDIVKKTFRVVIGREFKSCLLRKAAFC